MNRLTSLTTGLAAAALGVAAFAPGATAAPVASAAPGADFRTTSSSEAPEGTRAYGLLLGGALASFSLDDPRDTDRLGPITGYAEGDTALVGIDIRPSSGDLYGVGNGGGVYIIDPADQTAENVGTLSVPLAGEQFGVDFNPAADALRIVSDTSQNLRVTFSGPAVATTVADGSLNSGAVPPVPVTGVSGAAYTNNDNSALTGTSLLDVNPVVRNLAVQAPANQGSLSPVGNLRRNFGPDTSFDVFSRTNARGVTIDNAGYAVSDRGTSQLLWRVNLTTGQATQVGTFPQNRRVGDLAIELPDNTTPVALP